MKNLLLLLLIKLSNFTVFIILIFLVSNTYPQQKHQGKKMDIKITSTAFKNGNIIPAKYTCEGENVSPELKWTTKVKGIKTFVLIVDDPDAPNGDFVHWVVYNIPDDVNELHEEVTTTRNVPDEVSQGTNSFGRIGYRGPCPPAGNPHRYFFRLYALDSALHLESGAEKHQVQKAMKGHILAEGELMGKYKR